MNFWLACNFPYFTAMTFRLSTARYDEIEEEANRILLTQASIIPPFNIDGIAGRLSVSFIYLSHLPTEKRRQLVKVFINKKNEAILFNDNGRKMVIIDDVMHPKSRVYFTKAHELGHIVLGHLEHSGLAEYEANVFARCLVAPYGIARIMIREDLTVEELQNSLCISKEAASYCWDRTIGRLAWHDHEMPDSTRLLSERYKKERGLYVTV